MVRNIRNGQYLVTQGLKKLKGFELRVLVREHSEESYSRVLTYVCDYLISESVNIVNEETIAFHSWLLKFKLEEAEIVDLWEASDGGDSFLQGVDYALTVVQEQEEECRRRNVTPLFPTFGQKIVISKGVYEGCGVDAVRYSSPKHMTGWWVTTDLYDGNIESLMTVYFYNLAFKRPDILKYFALPFGYRFYITDEEKDVWFDGKVLEE